MFLKKCHIIALSSQQTTENNEFLLKHVVAMHWTHQITLCHQPCHGGFTAKITGSPNMVCTVNHATEDLQRRLLILQIWFVQSTMPRRIYNGDYWFSKYGLYSQPCHGGFTVKITDSPNMVCVVNHAMEVLQWRLLILQIWFVWGFTA